MLFSSTSKESPRPRATAHRVGPFLRNLPIVFFIIGTGVTVTLWLIIQGIEHRRMHQETQITAEQVRRRLESFIDTRTASVDYLCSREFTDSLDVRENFRAAASHFVQLYPGIQALNFIDNEGIIQIVVPEIPNAAALGQDLRHDPRPNVTTALERAEATGSISRTSVIDLFQGGKGFATYEPLRTETGKQLGFANCVFRVETLMDSCLSEPELRDRFRFEVDDVGARPAYLHPSDDEDEEWPMSVVLQVRVVDRPWTLRFAPNPKYLATTQTFADEVLALVGFILIVALALALKALIERHEALAESQENYKLLVENQSDMVVKMDPGGHFLYLSPSCFHFFAKSEEELSGTEFLSLIHPDDRDAVTRALAGLSHPPHSCYFEVRAMTAGGWRWLSWSVTSILDDGGQVREIIAVGTDITRRRELEDQLIQSQKLQAVGQLAGGIAHDFNNILQAMIGYLEFANREIPADSTARKDLDQVHKGIDRAIHLTRQLLAFSRRQALNPEVIDLNEVCRDTIEMLRRLMGESLEIRFEANPESPAVYADRSQLDQVLMNLCVNARDAMDGSGTITIRTGKRLVDEHFVEDHPDTYAGPYAFLEVSDHGSGMSREIQEHVFEPFFTTKEVGAGTGIGLATVYGIVRQHGGAIDLESAVGKGTKVTVYLPASNAAVTKNAQEADEPMGGNGETILVAEDDRLVREIATRVLERGGYRVLAASNGKEALDLYELHKDEIALSVLDVVMPKMGGHETSLRIRALNPEAGILFVSGYNPSDVEGSFELEAGEEVLMKPYVAENFLARIHDLLHSHA